MKVADGPNVRLGSIAANEVSRSPPEAVNDPAYDEVTVGSFNLLRLFDEVNDSNGAVTI